MVRFMVHARCARWPVTLLPQQTGITTPLAMRQGELFEALLRNDLDALAGCETGQSL